MVTVGPAVKWDYGHADGRAIPIAEHYLTASAPLLPNQDKATHDMTAPYWAGGLQPTR